MPLLLLKAVIICGRLTCGRYYIFRYVPGQFLVEAGGMKAGDFEIPETTTLLLVGAMGAGKSTLINNLIRVLNNKTRDFDRAQVCGQSS